MFILCITIFIKDVVFSVKIGMSSWPKVLCIKQRFQTKSFMNFSFDLNTKPKVIHCRLKDDMPPCLPIGVENNFPITNM